MAGFAVVMTILTDGALGIVLASVSSLVLYLVAKRAIVHTAPARRHLIAVSILTPFFCLGWLVVALLLHVEISNRIAHQDCGFSPDPYVTLSNGYVVGSANTYSGYVVAPGFHTDVPSTGAGYVRSLVDLRWKGDLFSGTYVDIPTRHLHSFLFNTRDGSIKSVDLSEVVDFGDQQTRVHEDENAYWVLYSQNRHRWPSFVLIVLLFAGEIGIGLWLLQEFARARLRES